MNTETATESDLRWQALARRDSKADGQFVYAVRTTGVYCRPSCASRPAKARNVVFYASCSEAEDAGYRACKRCRPDGLSIRGDHARAVAELCREMEASDESRTLAQLSVRAGMSPYHLHRVFKAQTGVTPHAYAMACRDRRTREHLQQSGTVTDAIYEAGYQSSGRFYARADQALGMKPSSYRSGGAHASIRFALGECSLGTILVAQSERGICAISLGEDPESLVRDLQDRFPQAELVGGDPGFEQTVAQVVGLVEAPGVGLELPLDVQGTAFQKRVWQALQRIPPGATTTYADVAAAIGSPRAVRAVGRACGANTLAIAIPCHRVVRQDGVLSGYRWGVERKKALLERESGR